MNRGRIAYNLISAGEHIAEGDSLKLTAMRVRVILTALEAMIEEEAAA